jgi:hypothetical protein
MSMSAGGRPRGFPLTPLRQGRRPDWGPDGGAARSVLAVASSAAVRVLADMPCMVGPKRGAAQADWASWR